MSKKGKGKGKEKLNYLIILFGLLIFKISNAMNDPNIPTIKSETELPHDSHAKLYAYTTIIRSITSQRKLIPVEKRNANRLFRLNR